MDDEKRSEEEEKEVGLYEKLAERSKELMDEVKGKAGETLDVAIKKAKEEMVAAGDFSHEQGERLKAFLERDIQLTREYAGKAGEAAKELLEPHRVTAGIESTLAGILKALGDKFGEWAEKLESELSFKTGELTTPGTLTCRKCGEKLKMLRTGHVPPCPKCRATEFHKSY